MRSMLAKTFLVAAALTLFAVGTSVVVTARPLTPVEASSVSTDNGFASKEPGTNPIAGFRVLKTLLKDPGFGFSVLAPQALAVFPFMWLAAILGSRLRSVSGRA